jgi:hypothetical protein
VHIVHNANVVVSMDDYHEESLKKTARRFCKSIGRPLAKPMHSFAACKFPSYQAIDNLTYPGS